MRESGEYALKDEYILPGSGKNVVLFGAKNIFPGKVLVVPGLTQYTTINTTVELGLSSLVGISMAAWFGKNNYKSRKVEEWIEVSPHHVQYYQLVMKQRDEIENKIREGLIRISQSLTDIELLEHDIRKYERYAELIDESSKDLSKLEERAKKDKSARDELEREKRKKKTAEMALKSIFVDQVDYNAGKTGQGPGRLSMAFMRNSNIFPTIVDDFMEMESLDDLENGNLKSLPVVEKNFLRVKFRYYLQWKEMFGKQVKIRLERLKAMHRSRMASLEEFKKWAVPFLVRLKAINSAFQHPGGFIGLHKKLTVAQPGEALGLSGFKIWAWRGLTPAETFRESGELKELSKLYESYPGEFTSAWNDFTRDVLVFGQKYGLINEYPWITEKWVENAVKKYISEVNQYDFWTFVIFVMTKAVFKNPKAGEFEDTDWEIYAITMSSNALLVKLIEAEASDEELKFYVDAMLGREVALKKVDKFAGYIEEAGKYFVVKEGDYLRDSNGKKIEFSSLMELFSKMSSKLGDFRPVPGEIIYYKKKRNKYIIEEGDSKVYDSLEDFVNERRRKAKELSDPLEKAKMLSFVLKPETSHKIKEFMKDWLGIDIENWKYRKYPGLTYERDFYDRITQYYLVPTGSRWAGVVGTLKSKFGI